MEEDDRYEGGETVTDPIGRPSEIESSRKLISGKATVDNSLEEDTYNDHTYSRSIESKLVFEHVEQRKL